MMSYVCMRWCIRSWRLQLRAFNEQRKASGWRPQRVELYITPNGTKFIDK